MINQVRMMIAKVLGYFRKNAETPEYYVCSFEPFDTKPIWRGPFTQKDASALISINRACGSDDHLYKDIDGVLVQT